MKTSLIVRGRILDAARPSDITVRDGKITRIAPAGKTPADFGGSEARLGPLLFDSQVNGAAGHDIQGATVTPESLRAIAEYLLDWGVVRFVPTLVTAALDEMEHGCAIIAEALERDKRLARAIPGIHLEGPWISPEDGPRGAHPRAHVRPPARKDFERLHKAARGRILYVTLAPEYPGALPLIRAIVARNVSVSLGHHAANAAQIAAAVEAGATLCTHLGNGAASMIHRHSNPLWPQMADDRLTAGIIADLHHLPAPALKTMIRAKTPARVILVSDSTNLAGMPPGRYQFGGAAVDLAKNGKISLAGTDLLAGSALMLLQGVVNAWRETDMTLAEAFAAAGSIPAKALGVPAPKNPFQIGKPAKFILFNATNPGPVQVETVMS